MDPNSKSSPSSAHESWLGVPGKEKESPELLLCRRPWWSSIMGVGLVCGCVTVKISEVDEAFIKR